MATVIKATARDFERLFPLLARLNPGIGKEAWRQFFVNHWHSDENYFGYALMDNDEPMGFIGTIFSKRIIDGQEHRFCNLSSWIVKEEARNKSLYLILPIMKLTDYTVTILTLREKLGLIWEKYGYQRINSRCRMLNPWSNFTSMFSRERCFCTFDSQIIQEHLTPAELKIYRDHKKFHCWSVLLEARGETCLVILRRPIRVHLPFAYVHYLSNINLFARCMNHLTLRIMAKLKVMGVVVPERLLQNCDIPGTLNSLISVPRIYNRMFKSSALESWQIDDLYSELFILDY